MKKSTTLMWIIAVISVILYFLSPTYAKAEASCEYPTCGVVVEVNEEENLVTFQDFMGNQWSFKDTEDWYVNDICACIMNDNGTATVYDDVIISVQYCGWI